MKSCDTCIYFQRIKNLKFWQGRIGICNYEDGSLSGVIKNCKNFKGEKYNRNDNKKELIVCQENTDQQK